MKKIKNFLQVGEALHRRTNQEKENFRRSYNSKYVECQAYEDEKLNRNQDLINGLRLIMQKGKSTETPKISTHSIGK